MVWVELCKGSVHRLNGCFQFQQTPKGTNLIARKEQTKKVLLFVLRNLKVAIVGRVPINYKQINFILID